MFNMLHLWGFKENPKKHIVSVWVVLHKRTLAPMGDDDDAEDILMALLTYPCPLSGRLRTAGAKSPERQMECLSKHY